MTEPVKSATLSIEALRRIDVACTRFEQSEAADVQVIAGFLDGFEGAEREGLRDELISLDHEMRRQSGRGDRDAEEYVCLFAGETDIDVVRSRIQSLIGGIDESDAAPVRSTRYEFLERVGTGGVCHVWRVRDNYADRPLAVKLLHPRFADDRHAKSRLEREALLTGSLQHPGVPPVYDHGRLDDGSIFFAMKLVEGDTLENILKGRDRAGDDLAHCLGIFEQVSQTLAYAHSQGIIHRDLKPHNIMVGRFGEVQVMDWGMAKRLGIASESVGPRPLAEKDRVLADNDRAARQLTPRQSDQDTASAADDSSWNDARQSLTAAGDVLGTPCYMPPEQARGQVESLDQRSDVFGLGAILFELLTGSRLYREGTAGEVLTRAAAGDLSDAIDRLRAADVDSDLEELCARCLSVERDGRPAHAGEVAERVGGYLTGVQDRLKQAEFDRREALVRAAEEAKRRKTLTMMVTAVIAVSLLGIAGVGWQWKQAVNASDKANNALELADERLGKAQQIVNDYLTEVARDDGVLSQHSGMQSLQRTLLEKARHYYVQFLDESQDDPAVRYEAAQAHARLGNITYVLEPGSEETFQHYARAIELYEELIDDHGQRPEYQIGVATARSKIAAAHFTASNFSEAVQSYSESASVWSGLCLSRGDPGDVLGLAKSTHNIGHAMSKLGQKKQAEKYLVESLELSIPLLESHGDDPEYLFAISNQHSNAGTFFGFKMRDWDRSLELYQESVRLREKLIGIEPDQHRNQNALAGGYNNVGLALYQAKRFDDAENAFLKAAEIREKLIRENPAIAQYAEELGDTYTNLGTFSAKRGRVAAAIKFYDKSVATFLRLYDQHPKIRSYAIDAIAATLSIAECNATGPRAEGAVRDATKLYARIHERWPEADNYVRLWALYSAVLPETKSDWLVKITDRFELTNNPNSSELTVRALALYRDGKFPLAAAHLEAIPVKEYDKVTWAVASLIQTRLDHRDAAAKSLAQAKKLMKKKYPDFHHVVLVAEAEEIFEKDDL